MLVKIFTLSFDQSKQQFDAKKFDEFSVNKKINQVSDYFFSQGSATYLCLIVKYELVKREFFGVQCSTSLTNGGPNQSIHEPLYPHDFIELSFKDKERIFQECASFYEQGYSLRSTQEKTGIAKTTLRRSLKENGLALRKQFSGKGKNYCLDKSRRGGGCPYGFAFFDGQLVVDPKETLIVRQIMKLHFEDKSNLAIAKYLNGKKIPTRLHGSWRDSTIRLIIKRQKEIKNKGRL
jgi:hypothetical protein